MAPSSSNQRSADSTSAVGVLVRSRGRDDEHLRAAACGEQVAVEVTAVAPLGATDQGKGAGHGPHLPVPESGPRLLPVGSVAAHDHHDAWASSVRGSWGRASPRWPPSRASRSCCARASRTRRTRWSPRLEKSLAKQVERGKLEEHGRQGDRRAGQRHRRPPRPARLRPRARVRGRGPRGQEGAVHPARRHRASPRPSSPRTPPPCRSSSWPWRPSAPTRSSASTSSTRRR